MILWIILAFFGGVMFGFFLTTLMVVSGMKDDRDDFV